MNKTEAFAHSDAVGLSQQDMDRLTGKTAKNPHPPAITAPGQGGKFAFDGHVLAFPGNTFICHIDPASKAYATLCALQDVIRSGPAGDYFTYLPPLSFHMTVFPAICGSPLGEDGWPDDIEPGANLNEVTDTYKNRLEGKTAFRSCRVEPIGLLAGFSLSVEGAGDADKFALQNARDMLQDVTALRRPGFHDYRFHITMCYIKKWLPEDIAAEHLRYMSHAYNLVCDDLSGIELGAVEFCNFENMHAFNTLMLLPAE